MQKKEWIEFFQCKRLLAQELLVNIPSCFAKTSNALKLTSWESWWLHQHFFKTGSELLYILKMLLLTEFSMHMPTIRKKFVAINFLVIVLTLKAMVPEDSQNPIHTITWHFTLKDCHYNVYNIWQHIPYSEKHSVFCFHLVGDSCLQTSNPAHVELLVFPRDGLEVPMLL